MDKQEDCAVIDRWVKWQQQVQNGEVNLDLSADQDLVVAVMNLMGVEEHLFFTGVKTDKTIYFTLLQEVRECRKELLGKLIKDYEGEIWCTAKHLLAASYRLMEVGTKLLSAGKNEEAYAMFKRSYQMYALFFGLVGGKGECSSAAIEEANKLAMSVDPSQTCAAEEYGSDTPSQAPAGTSVLERLSSVLKKALNCCVE